MSGVLPDGACDAHCHVFGPAAVFPFAANRTYTPADAPKEDLVALHGALGFDWAVVVQPGAHGHDHSAALDAISASGGRWRGVALLSETTTTADVARLHAGGMRGARFNFISHLGGAPTERHFRTVADLIAPFGWHVVFHLGPEDLPLARRYVEPLEISFVIDHMARIDTSGGLEQPAFRHLLDCLADPRAWVKLSGADRASAARAPFSDIIPFMSELVRAAPERCLWGTDWPHPNIKGPVPNEQDLLQVLRSATGSDESGVLQRILVNNPVTLYRP